MNIWLIILGLACVVLLVSLMLEHRGLKKERRARQRFQNWGFWKFKNELVGFLTRSARGLPKSVSSVAVRWSTGDVGELLRVLVTAALLGGRTLLSGELLKRLLRHAVGVQWNSRGTVKGKSQTLLFPVDGSSGRFLKVVVQPATFFF